jgi:hypothetical protein
MKKPNKKRSVAVTRKPRLAAGVEEPGANSRQAKHVLCLYVSGSTSKSALAIANIKRICEQHLKNRYDLEVIDIHPAKDYPLVAFFDRLRDMGDPAGASRHVHSALADALG